MTMQTNSTQNLKSLAEKRKKDDFVGKNTYSKTKDKSSL